MNEKCEIVKKKIDDEVNKMSKIYLKCCFELNLVDKKLCKYEVIIN